MLRIRTSAAVASLFLGCASAPAAAPRSEPPPAGPGRVLERVERRGRAEAEAASVETEGLGPLLPEGITSFGMASVAGDLYVLGGFTGEPHRYVAADQSAELRVWRAGSARWESLAPIAAGLQSVALVPSEGGLHRVGGMRVTQPGVLRSTAEHQRYDIGRGQWRDAPPLPEARSSHEAVAVDEAIYVVGGWQLAGDASTGVLARTMLRFRGGRWESMESPVERRAVGAAASSDLLMVAGGLTEGGISQRVDLYDVAARRWSRGPDLPGERSGFGVAIVSCEGAFLASGMDGLVWRWAPGEQAWGQVGALRFGRFFHRMAHLGDSVVVVGGIGGMHTEGRTRIVEMLEASGARPAVATVTLPWPGKAKNRQAMFLVGDHLYLFGGNDSLDQHAFDAERFQDEGWRVHLPSLAIEERAPYPFRRQTMASRVERADGEPSVIVAGGFGHQPTDAGPGGATVARTQRELFHYDVVHDHFEAGPSLPAARSQTDLVRGPDGSIYVVGGLDYDPRRESGDSFRHRVEVAALAPSAEAFVTLEAELPEPRRAFAAATSGDVHYLTGGMRDGFQLVDSCTRFDLVGRTFAPFTCPSRTRLGGDLVAVGAHLALVGGTAREGEGLVEVRQVERYDPARDAWQMLAPELPFSPRHARAFAYRGGVLLVSTHDPEPVMRLAFVDVTE